MDINTKVTYFPLKMQDGLFHILKRTEILPPHSEVVEVKDCEPFEDKFLADEMVETLNNIKEYNEDLSNIQSTS